MNIVQLVKELKDRNCHVKGCGNGAIRLEKNECSLDVLTEFLGIKKIRGE
jgi:hypothetical protein